MLHVALLPREALPAKCMNSVRYECSIKSFQSPPSFRLLARTLTSHPRSSVQQWTCDKKMCETRTHWDCSHMPKCARSPPWTSCRRTRGAFFNEKLFPTHLPDQNNLSHFRNLSTCSEVRKSQCVVPMLGGASGA